MRQFLIRKGDLKARNYKKTFLYSGEVYFHVVESTDVANAFEEIRALLPKIKDNLECFKMSTEEVDKIKEVLARFPERQK